MLHPAPLTVSCLVLVALAAMARLVAAEPEALFDWSDVEKFRDGVVHPSGAYKSSDVARARENLTRYGWAKTYLAAL